MVRRNPGWREVEVGSAWASTMLLQKSFVDSTPRLVLPPEMDPGEDRQVLEGWNGLPGVAQSRSGQRDRVALKVPWYHQRLVFQVTPLYYPTNTSSVTVYLPHVFTLVPALCSELFLVCTLYFLLAAQTILRN